MHSPFTAAYATEVPAEVANEVISHRLAMPTPTTAFAQWEADQWQFHAQNCARAAGVPVPAKLQTAKRYGSGSWQLPSNSAKTCLALAKGPAPTCYDLVSRDTPFQPPQRGLPSNYAFLGASGVQEGLRVMVGGFCELVSGKPETQQYYTGPAIVKWRVPLARQTLHTAKGAQQLEVGSLEFRGEGLPPAGATLVIAP